MIRDYNNPPLIEALCEFRFLSTEGWDITVPGLIYASVKSDFPIKQSQNGIEVKIDPTKKVIEQSLTDDRAQFFREDGSALIQVGPQLLTINHLRPYPKWPTFRALIARAFKTYCEVVPNSEIVRISLRYINQIQIPEESYLVEEYLSVYPEAPEGVAPFMASYVQRLELPLVDSNGLLILQTGSQENLDKGYSTIMLDLDFVSLKVESSNLDDVMDWIEKAHSEVERVFENCITSKTRALFGERG